MKSRRRAAWLVLRVAFVPLVGAAAFLLACAAVEIAVYAKKPAAYARRATVRSDTSDAIFDAFLGTCFTKGDYLPFALAPGRYTLTGGRSVTISPLGYRGRKFASRKPPGTTRILFLGDSFTYGYGADDEYTIPRLVEKKLQGRFANLEVINAGFHGFSPMQYDLYLRKEGFALAPDLVVLVVYPGNDLSDVYYNFVKDYDSQGLPERIADGLVCHEGRRYHSLLPGWLYRAPVLDRSVLWYYMNRRAYASVRRWQQREITKEGSQEFFRRPTLRLIEETRRRNIELSVWVIAGRETIDPRSCPWLHTDADIETQGESRRFVLDCLRAAGADYLDLAPALAVARSDEGCLPRDGHLNAHGNALVATAGASRLRDSLAALTSKPTAQTAQDSSVWRGTLDADPTARTPNGLIRVPEAQLTAQTPLESDNPEPSR